MSDRALARKVIEGDPRASRAFVDTHYAPVLKSLILLTGTEEDAVDLAQQTFLKAREALPEFRFESSLRTWLHRIAYHEYTHWLRKQSRETSAPTVEPSTEMNEDGIVLAEAIAALPNTCREAFVLREVHRLSVREAAEVLGVPKGTVKSRCSTARSLLVRRLGSTFGASNPNLCEADHVE